MNVLALYLIVASIALYLLYFVKRPKIRFIENLKEKSAKKYVEFVPISKRYLQDIPDRYIVLNGVIRKDMIYYNGWFVYDKERQTYVDPELTSSRITTNKAQLLCDKLNEEENIYQQEIGNYTKN